MQLSDLPAVPHIAVVIPALNEEASLPHVLRDIPRERARAVIVVDNGSHDGTARVAREAGALVFREEQRGYGAACLRGLAELANRPEGPPDIVVFLDADYSDHPDEMPAVVAPILQGDADMVIGSRLLGNRERGAMPPQSVWGNRLACFLMRILFGGRYTDLGPFRAIRWDSLQKLGMCDRNFGWTVEMQIKAARQRLRCVEVPVSYRRRIGASKISGTVSGTIKAGSKILYLIAKYGLSRHPAVSSPSVGNGLRAVPKSPAEIEMAGASRNATEGVPYSAVPKSPAEIEMAGASRNATEGVPYSAPDGSQPMSANPVPTTLSSPPQAS